jgi:hypothetical protein
LKRRERLMVWFDITNNNITGIRLCPVCFTYTMSKNKELIGRYSIVMDRIAIYETLNNIRNMNYLNWVKNARHQFLRNATFEELDKTKN